MEPQRQREAEDPARPKRQPMSFQVGRGLKVVVTSARELTGQEVVKALEAAADMARSALEGEPYDDEN